MGKEGYEVNTQTNVQTTALATGVAAIFMWLMGYFAPDLMAAAPTGLEAILTGMIIAVIGLLLPKEKLERGNGNG